MVGFFISIKACGYWKCSQLFYYLHLLRSRTNECLTVFLSWNMTSVLVMDFSLFAIKDVDWNWYKVDEHYSGWLKGKSIDNTGENRHRHWQVRTQIICHKSLPFHTTKDLIYLGQRNLFNCWIVKPLQPGVINHPLND